ncbi:esterase [Corynebacterium yudongzhengii]|uniref:Esterase family protein n=1 Tax=Corynebacterium yudongzhengii TaxID=2080740 RepID=A0A2U1T827_9CORY|nr:alpha/beta hydrolase family protein [Corynebacterium yudongzhengii]AWB82783.1 esterase [Corynebacterium yudongzhengii]PWC02157.1 esterase family protein [Corynebacterium yudongzhengii]
MSTITAGAQRVARMALALVTAVTLAVTLMLVPNNSAQAQDNRGWLRPDATGTCEWDPNVQYWVQRCDVWSASMGRSIPVQIVPAARGGNAALYLLDGLRATERTNAWVNDTNAARTYENTNITLVMPVGGTASFYADWAGPATYDLQNPVKYQWETFLTSELPDYLQRYFGVAPNNNSVAGLSMGGTAAINLASRHPDQFRQALSFSGYLTMTLPGAQTLLRVALLDAGGFNVNAMYGSMLNPRRFENDPFLNMGGLRGTDVYVSAASGIPSPADQNIAPQHVASGAALEMISNLSTRLYAGKARFEGINLTENYPPTGLHNWNQFGYQLDITKGRVLDVMNAY